MSRIQIMIRTMTYALIACRAALAIALRRTSNLAIGACAFNGGLACLLILSAGSCARCLHALLRRIRYPYLSSCMRMHSRDKGGVSVPGGALPLLIACALCGHDYEHFM